MNSQRFLSISSTNPEKAHKLGLADNGYVASEHAYAILNSNFTSIQSCANLSPCFWYILFCLLQNRHTLVSSENSTVFHWLRIQLECSRVNCNRSCCAVNFGPIAGLHATIFCSRNLLLTIERLTVVLRAAWGCYCSPTALENRLRKDVETIKRSAALSLWSTPPDEATSLLKPFEDSSNDKNKSNDKTA